MRRHNGDQPRARCDSAIVCRGRNVLVSEQASSTVFKRYVRRVLEASTHSVGPSQLIFLGFRSREEEAHLRVCHPEISTMSYGSWFSIRVDCVNGYHRVSYLSCARLKGLAAKET